MPRHTINVRRLPGTDSGWKHAVNSQVVPVTIYEVLNGERRIVAAFRNDASTPGNICPDVAARNECRYRNRDFTEAGMKYWERVTNRRPIVTTK